MLGNSKTITEKLLDAFPGYYGRFVCLHFARFLNEPIKTKKQKVAYETIVTFLDNAPEFNLSEELQEYLIYDVFIPALKQLSNSYAEYYSHIEVANEKLLFHYPKISEISD